MKKVLLTLLVLVAVPTGAMAQDDVYFVPTKKAILKERQAERQGEIQQAKSSYTPIEVSDTDAEYDTWADGQNNTTMDVDADSSLIRKTTTRWPCRQHQLHSREIRKRQAAPRHAW